MESNISWMVKLYQFPMGRAKFALHSVSQRAVESGATELATLAANSAGQVQYAINLAARYESAGAGQYPPQTALMDTKLDNCIGGLHGYFEAQMRSYMGEIRAEAAERLREVCFPLGVGAITQIAYAEQHAEVDAMLARIAEPAHANDVAVLDELPALLQRVRMLNNQYGALLRQGNGPAREQVRAGRARVQELVCQVACAIIGHYAMQTPDDTAERDRVLQPILDQNEAIRVARRRRRAALDIDPQTGEELPDDSIAEPTNDATDETLDSAEGTLDSEVTPTDSAVS